MTNRWEFVSLNPGQAKMFLQSLSLKIGVCYLETEVKPLLVCAVRWLQVHNYVNVDYFICLPYLFMDHGCVKRHHRQQADIQH